LRYRKPAGLIYIWLYANEDVDYTIKTRVNWIIEAIFRPKIAALPDFWQNQVVRHMARRHYKIYKECGTYSKEQWTMANSEHFIRDRWTALFAHRHMFNDVIQWFLGNGFEYRLINSKKYYDHFKVLLIGIGIRGIPSEIFAEQKSWQREECPVLDSRTAWPDRRDHADG
jgi:hypothetical protein